MRPTARQLWLFALAVSTTAHAQGLDAFGLATCKTSRQLEVYAHLDQDEAGPRCELRRFTFSDGGVTAETRSSECLELPTTQGSSRTLDWVDAGCQPLRRVALRFDVKAVAGRPTPLQLEHSEQGGVPVRSEAFWQEPLHRRLEVSARGTRLAAVDVELQAPDVLLEAFDVGDGHHLLLAVRWTFAHSEGAPVSDQWFQLVRFDGSRLRSATDDAGVQVVRVVGALDALVRWRELARWQDSVATALEARRSARAKEARALSNRRTRQAALVERREFTSVLEACDAFAAASADETLRDALVAATARLHAATRPLDWPLVVEALDWSRSTCGDLVSTQPDAGAWTQDFGPPR